MLHLTPEGAVIVGFLILVLFVLTSMEVRHLKHQRHVDHTMLEWHYLVVDEEVRGTRRIGERFYDELDLVDWESAHPEVYKRPEKYPANAWFD